MTRASFGGRQAAREADELAARNADVDEHARQLDVVERHRLGCDLQVEPVGDDEAVDDVELRRGAAVHARRRRRLRRPAPAPGRSARRRRRARARAAARRALRASSRRSRAVNRRLRIGEQASLRVGGRGLADELGGAPRRRGSRAAPPTPRARRRSRGAAGAPCTRRAADRPGRRRAPRRARGSRRARPARGARDLGLERRVSGVARISARVDRRPREARRASRRRAASGRRRDEVGPPWRRAGSRASGSKLIALRL